MRHFIFASLLLLPGTVWSGGTVARQKLYITNSAGDDVTIVDVPSHKVIRSLKVGPRPHGIAAPAGGDFIVVSIEGGKTGELVWIDPRKDEIVDRMMIRPAPHRPTRRGVFGAFLWPDGAPIAPMLPHPIRKGTAAILGP